MGRQFSQYLLILFAATVSISSCANNSAEIEKLKEENIQLKAEIQQLKSTQQSTQSANDTQSTNSSQSAQTTRAAATTASPPGSTSNDTGASTSTTSSTTSADPSATASKGFTDIAGAFGEKEIKDLVKVGVLDASSGTFNPTKPITRAEFIEWLVKSNNAIRPKKDFIRTAEPGTPSSFTDLAESNPYFKYIQGMADAGWTIGFPDKTFKPDGILTREQMIGIKNPIDWNSEHYDSYTKFWTDAEKINKNFVVPMSTEAFAFYQCGHNSNWSRVYGKTKVCLPQKPVTRAEAAVCVWCIGRNPTDGYNAEKGAPPEN